MANMMSSNQSGSEGEDSDISPPALVPDAQPNPFSKMSFKWINWLTD